MVGQALTVPPCINLWGGGAIELPTLEHCRYFLIFTATSVQLSGKRESESFCGWVAHGVGAGSLGYRSEAQFKAASWLLIGT